MNRTIAAVGAAIVFTCGLSASRTVQQSAAPMPELPPDVPKDGDVRILISDVTPTGQDVVWKDADGTIHEFFQFNDRGRGPKAYTTYKLDADGVVIAEHTSGLNYMKNPVGETFMFSGGEAHWKNQSEDETVANASGRYFIDLNGGSEASALLVRAALKKKGKIPVLPSGEASVQKLQTVSVEGRSGEVNATLYEVTGLSLTPSYLWLDDSLRFFASTPGWLNTIRQGFEASAKKLQDAQQAVQEARSAELAKTLTHIPQGDLIIKNVSVFDSLSGKVLAHQRITVRDHHVLAVEDDQNQLLPARATVLDGDGKMALPGLWDMHQHIFPDTAFLDIAAGITTVRDLGNAPEALAKLRDNIPEKQIGPRILKAGFIDGRGPFQGPIAVFADTPEEAVAQVKKYADAGYVQIKVYSSLKTELVAVIAAEAHKRGMRLSGHVPAGMIAEQFVNAGADELQHINFVMLNFWPDVKETRNPQRFIVPGERSAALDLNSEPVARFVQFLKDHHTVVDPTMAIFEDTFLGRPGKIGPENAPMFDRLPVQTQRGIKTAGGALPVKDDETDRLYHASWAKMVAMVKKLYDGGVQIVAGTDQGDGYALHRELELYAEAGISPAEVLRIATIQAATVMHRQDTLGSISVGKHADIILVNGDPTKRIQDIRKIDTVIQNGNILRPAELYPAMGIRPN
jgi:imidazolonepropionase-like amidohydrolase